MIGIIIIITIIISIIIIIAVLGIWDFTTLIRLWKINISPED